MRALRFVACFLPLSLLPSLAWADDPKAAAERFREGQRAFDAHDYQRAATEFEAANRAKPAAAALVSAGLAWELGGDALNAAIDLAEALALGGLESRDEATAKRHLVDLDAEIGHLEMRGAVERVTIDGHNPGPLPVDVRVAPGVHAIEAQGTTGAAIHRVATVRPGATIQVDLTEDKPPPPMSPAAPMQRTLGWIGIGAGASLLVGGAVVGAVGLSARDQFVSGGNTSTSLHDEAVAMRTVATVLWVGAGVFAATGVVLLLTTPRSHAVTVGVGLSNVNLRVIF